MSKNKYVEQITKVYSKKGKVKGSNKKETKALVASCFHHKYNKRGKLKPMVFTNDGKYVVCTMCGAKFPASFYTNEQISDICAPMAEVVNQTKFTAVAINAGNEVCDYLANLSIGISNFKKVYKKNRKMAEKTGNMSKKHNKNKSNKMSGSSAYGGWKSNN